MMESKAFFEALLLNKHCTARLHSEERRLEQQQKLMYNRLWREKELLMDDYIHINVRTPSPQRVATPPFSTASAPPPPPPLRRARSSSSAELLKRNAWRAEPGRRKKQTPSVASPRPRARQSPALLSDPRGSETKPVSTTSRSEESSSNNHRSSHSKPRANAKSAATSLSSSSAAAAKQIDSSDRVGRDAASSVRASASVRESDNCAEDDQNPAWSRPLASMPHDQKQVKAKPKRTSKKETTLKKTYKCSSDNSHTDFVAKESKRNQSPSSGDANSSDLYCDQEPRTSDMWTAYDQLPAVSDSQTRVAPASTSLPSSRPPSSRSQGSGRKPPSGAVDSPRKQKLLAHQLKTNRWNSSGREGRIGTFDRPNRKLQSTKSDSDFLASDSGLEDDSVAEWKPCADSKEKPDNNSSDVPDVGITMLLTNRTDPAKDHHTTDANKEDQGRDKSHIAEPNADPIKKENSVPDGDGGDVKATTTSRYRPAGKKKAHVRQMTLDPKLVLPLSAKRYQCKKQATIIPVIAVQGRQATLYPNPEAKAGRVVTLDRKARGWIQRSTSILFYLDNIHSAADAAPAQQPASATSSALVTSRNMSSPGEEEDLAARDDAISSVLAAQQPDTVQHKHEPPSSTMTSSSLNQRTKDKHRRKSGTWNQTFTQTSIFFPNAPIQL
ncbi:uncharacterized protein LOC143281528 [Babylonia areolata]|uniref:uncharacterized protein LOC143281528 n=1 Tax=Babylonia areolata TaxID=304850 RepID=UPI003FD07A20